MSFFFKIEIAVGGGLYITDPDLFSTREAAEAARQKLGIPLTLSRVVGYQTGGWRGGAVRIDD